MKLVENDRAEHNNKNISDKDGNVLGESNFHYWQSQPYRKSFVKTKSFDKTFLYYDTSSIIKYLFFHWVRKWMIYTSEKFVEPYKLHPLPVSDQILNWQPIFSKHVSDALVKLESYETLKSKSNKVDRRFHPYRSILFRALFLTFWKRLLFVVVGIIATNVLSMSIAILVKRLFKTLNDKSSTLVGVIIMTLVIVGLQLADSIACDNLDFYMFRLTYIVQYSFSITTFQHGLCCRRYFNNIEGCNSLNACNSVLHSASPDSECSKNPLFCPALRYQSKDLGPQIFIFEINDTFFVSQAVESVKFVVDFLSNFFYGIYLISYQVKVNIWYLYVVGISFIVLVAIIEIINAYILHYILHLRDYRVSKCSETLPSLNIIRKMLYDDIAINFITVCRNNELIILFIRNFLVFLIISLYNICTNVSFFLLLRYFINSVNNASVITEIDTAGFLTSLYIFLRIISSMYMIPYAIETLSTSFVSYYRIKSYIKDCSPNFYISDRFIGFKNMSSNINETTTDLEKDVVVLYKNATFTWVSSRNDLLANNYQPYLKNVDFELRRGDIVIVTGSQGSGKSNFIKSVLGEMTLVGGSMAVVPLHTSMPIFYASQDAWLERGTIRSNILFGHRFDEDIYSTVLKAVELEYDISTWEKGDMRVVSDIAHSLSGGQRVRMEMARAIYAYLIFNQVNKQYNNNKCSFLVCLDSSFNPLDPFVAKTVFSNLFNIKSGILVKKDLSVILTITKQSLDKCTSSSDPNTFPKIQIYNAVDKSISYYSNLSDFLSSNEKIDSYVYPPKLPNVMYKMNYFLNDMFNLCLSVSHTRMGRRAVTKTKYEESFKTSAEDELSRIRFNPYLIYITPAVFTFIVFIAITFGLTVLDDVKFVVTTNLTDYLSKNINDYKKGILIDLSEVKSHSRYLSKVVTIMILFIIILSLILVVFITVSCINSTRKIHEYCISSIFNHSSSVLKIKKQISKIITYLAVDMKLIDDDISHLFSIVITSLVHTVIQIVTLFYLIPISIPFLLMSLLFIYQFLFKQYINSSVNIKFIYLEIMSNINNVYENGISGPSIYRSFKKEWKLFHELNEHQDYKMRCKFLSKAVRSYSSVAFNWIFSFTTLLVLIILIIFDRTSKYKLSVGYFGLWLSMSMKVAKTFTNFSFNLAKLQTIMLSLKRFQYFIPPGQKCKFEKSLNPNEEFLPINSTENNYKFDKKQLLKRRFDEFKSSNKRLLALKRILFKPKINIVDLTKYVPTKHSGVELKNVHVYTSPEQNKDSAILKGLSVSAHRSDIIGIIGRTGAGKTTLLTVLENTARYRTGQVLLDGTDLKDIPKNVTRQIIGVLPQLPFVFKGWTVRRFLDPRKLFRDNEINQALDMCGLLDFVNDLQGGNKLDSIIINEEIQLDNPKYETSEETNKKLTTDKSEKSSSLDTLQTYYQDADMLLTGNQLRTLSFARLVLYRYFYRVIIVDEPPASDTDTKGNNKDAVVPIYELLRKYFSHCTCFVTAHEASVLQLCNSVWAIHEGHLIRTCKTEEISANESISNIIEDILKS